MGINWWRRSVKSGVINPAKFTAQQRIPKAQGVPIVLRNGDFEAQARENNLFA